MSKKKATEAKAFDAEGKAAAQEAAQAEANRTGDPQSPDDFR